MSGAAVSWWGRTPEMREALAAWHAAVPAAWRSPVALQAVAMAASRSGRIEPAVWTACLLATRAPTQGHVCVVLDEVVWPKGVDRAALGVSGGPGAWAVALADSALVCTAGYAAPWVLDLGRVYAATAWQQEVSLAQGLSDRLGTAEPPADAPLLRSALSSLFPPNEDQPDRVDRQQLAAAIAAVRRAVVISGGPGTGKTWTVRKVLAVLAGQWLARGDRSGWPRIAVAAPTGKAAARVVQSIRQGLDAGSAQGLAAALPEGEPVQPLIDQLDGLTPWTLHRLLGWRVDTPTRFRHHAGNPLPWDIVVVDEASMVDAAMMSRLVDALHPDSRLVLLGDRHQLASVEAGTVLADLCGGGRARSTEVRVEPTLRRALTGDLGLDLRDEVVEERSDGPWDGITFLTFSRRFGAGSGIGRLAAACIRGDVSGVMQQAPAGPAPGPIEVGPDDKVAGPDVFRVVPTPSGRLPDAMRAFLVEGYRPVMARVSERPGADREAWLRSCLTALERFRVLAAHRRGRLGVEGLTEVIEEGLARMEVIATDEAYYPGRPLLITENDPGSGRFNGDVGLVVPAPDGRGRRVAFDGGGGRIEELSPVRLPAHETVYAMTIHKSQGSEHREVVVVLPEGGSRILTRELLYTGVTRAKQRVTLVASDDALGQAVAREVKRATGLADRLWVGASGGD